FGFFHYLLDTIAQFPFETLGISSFWETLNINLIQLKTNHNHQTTTTMFSTTTTISTAFSLLLTLTNALPHPLPFGDPTNPSIEFYYPATLSLYNSTSGSIAYDSPTGALQSSPGSPHTISTLIEFYFNNPNSASKTCEFKFELDDPDYVIAPSSSLEFDVYTSTGAASKSSAGWGANDGGKGNQRGNFMGRLRATPGGQAETVMGSMLFECGAAEAGVAKGWEVVPVVTAGTAGMDVVFSKRDGAWIEFNKPLHKPILNPVLLLLLIRRPSKEPTPSLLTHEVRATRRHGMAPAVDLQPGDDAAVVVREAGKLAARVAFEGVAGWEQM
ncbi:hypothetical protein BU24DRAFT_486059, partial [Aaosphaeria arxii CBS 175.79]